MNLRTTISHLVYEHYEKLTEYVRQCRVLSSCEKLTIMVLILVLLENAQSGSFMMRHENLDTEN